MFSFSMDRFLTLPPLTQAFLIVIAIETLVFHWRFNNKSIDFGPTLLTTTGIFATFLGIAIGLNQFDSSNLTNLAANVPSLLNGLKTAFWASVAGVGGALTLKFRQFFFRSYGQQGHAGGFGYLGTDSDSTSTAVPFLVGIRQDMNSKFESLGLKLSTMNSTLDKMHSNLNEMNPNLNKINSNLDRMNLSLDKWTKTLNALKKAPRTTNNVNLELAQQLRSNSEILGRDITSLSNSFERMTHEFTAMIGKLSIALERFAEESPFDKRPPLDGMVRQTAEYQGTE